MNEKKAMPKVIGVAFFTL